MAAWIGPVIIAAAISGVINIVGWFVAFRNTRRLEQAKREEKIIDVQSALLAEIRSDHASLGYIDVPATMDLLKEKFAGSKGGYMPLIPRDAGTPIFQSVVSDISILPTDVIDPIVIYYKQHETIAHFAEDLRGIHFAELTGNQKLQMIEDYLSLKNHARSLAEDAIHALERSFGFPATTNKRASVPLAPESASEASEVSDVP